MSQRSNYTSGEISLQKEKMKINLPFSHFLLAIILLLFSMLIQAQAREFNSPKKTNSTTKKGFEFDPDNLVFGGNLGATFGDITYVEVSPTAGYLFKENWLVGLSARYIYFEDRSGLPFFPVYKTNIYGGGIFTQYFFLENFLAHAEYELLNLEDNTIINFGERINISSVFLGGGYRSSLGGSFYASILLLYNLNDTPQSPYTNPVLRIGFGVGLN